MDWENYLNRRLRRTKLSDNLLEFLHIQVALLQREDKFASEPPRNPETILSQDLKAKLQAGIPLVNTAELSPEAAFGDYFRDLLELLARYRRREVEAVRGKLQSGVLDIEAAAREVIDPPARSISCDADDDFARYLLWRSWKAQLRRQAEVWTPALSAAEEEGTTGTGRCPICGAIPDVAVLKGEGQRFLHCSLCGHYWLHPRMICPFCQSRSQDDMGYFEAEEIPKARINFCRACQGYIKTFDLRESAEEFQPEVEHILTLQLDVRAEQEGFRPGGKIKSESMNTNLT